MKEVSTKITKDYYISQITEETYYFCLSYLFVSLSQIDK